MNGISFSGLASGLDTAAIVQQLVDLERIPIQQLESRKAGEQQKLDLVAAFRGLVEGLQEKADELATSAAFFEFTVGGAADGFADVSVSSGATAGSHSIEVITTARTDRWAFDGVADPDADLATADGQQVSFDVNGTSYTVDVPDQTASSLNEIAALISQAAGDDVSTSVVNVGTDANPSHQLVLTSKDSGEDFRITNLASTVTGLTLTSPAVNNVTVGTNAQAIIDGLTIERSDNDFSDVIEGVSIDLLSATAGPVVFTVEPDKDVIKDKIQDLVDSYNDVIDFVNTQNQFDEEGGPGGNLFGDTILSSVRRSVNQALFDVDVDTVIADTEGYSTLTLVGIQQDNDGRLSIDETVLNDKMNTNFELFADLFVDSDGFDNGGAPPNTPEFYEDLTADSGLADKLSRAIDQMFDSFDGPINPTTGQPIVIKGLFDLKNDVFTGNIERFNKQVEAMERRLESFEETLVRRFTALENLMAQLNAQGAALTASLAGLPGVDAS